MRSMRPLIASFISLILVALSPGLGCYSAMANMVGSMGAASQSAGAGVGAAGVATVPVGPGGAVGSVNLSLPVGGLPVMSHAPALRTPISKWSGAVAQTPGAQVPAAVAETVLPTGFRALTMAQVQSFRALSGLPVALPGTRAPPTTARVRRSAFLPLQGRRAAALLGMSWGRGAALDKGEPAAGKSKGRRLLESLEASLPKFEGVQVGMGSRFFDGASNGRHFFFNPVRGVRNGARSSSKKSRLKKKGMPVERERDDGDGVDVSDLDELGNPRRRQDPGPDDVYDEFGGRGPGRADNEFLGGFTAPFLATALTFGIGFSAFSPAAVMMIPLYLGLIVPSIILHEMGHAWMADRLGDPTPRLAGRMSFKPRDLLTHIDPLMTVVVPILTLLFTGFIFGGARPVQVNPQNFRRPVSSMAKVALAGPAVNFMLAVGAGVIHAVLAALGVSGIALSLVAVTAMFNVMLGMFNLLPFAPLDGHHLVRYVITNWFKAPHIARKLDSMRGIQIVGLIATLMLFSGPLIAGIKFVTGLVLGGPMLLLGGAPVQMASALLPALMAAGLLLGQVKGKVSPPNSMIPELGTAITTEQIPEPVDVIVKLDGATKPLSHDIHLSLADVSQSGGMRLYSVMQQSMEEQLEQAGLGRKALEAYGATPVATYRRINTATIRVPGSKAAEFKAAMEGRGFSVFDNERREIIKPIEDDPGFKKQNLPQGGALTMPDTLTLSTADKVHQIARRQWGDPGEGLLARAARAALRLFGVKIPQPKVGVLDTGADTTHQLLKGVKEVKNVTSGPNKDDNGHGTWTTSMVLWFAPWLRSVTHYKTFLNGGATLDDILKALTMSGNDGNLIVSNSWGSGRGDPKSPDSELVRKLAQEGHIMVFSAGNSGYYGKNRIGSPAIVHYRDAQTGAPRVIAVAATDAEKKVARFSSKGPGSYVTSRGEEYKDYPRKPDAAEQGENTEGAWPKDKGPGRIDPDLGPLRAISGTSMSAPKLAGTIALLTMMFGVTETGEDLDRIVNAVMDTLSNEYGQEDWSIGDGFNEVYLAYQKLKAEGLKPARSSWAARATLWLLGQHGTAALEAGIPNEAVAAYRSQRKQLGDLLVARSEHMRKKVELERAGVPDYRPGYLEGLNRRIDEAYAGLKAMKERYPEIDHYSRNGVSRGIRTFFRKAKDYFNLNKSTTVRRSHMIAAFVFAGVGAAATLLTTGPLVLILGAAALVGIIVSIISGVELKK